MLRDYATGWALFGCFVLTAGSAAQNPIARIINGQPTGDFAAVGIVGSTTEGGFCTGTLVSGLHVLTAGHCAQFIDDDAPGTFEVGGEVYAVVRVDIHPAFDAITLENDIAVLELAEPVPDIEPALIFRGEPLVGDELTIVGFGVGGTAAGGATGTFGTKQVGMTFVDDVDDLFVYWDFDDPAESNTAPGDSGGPGFIEVASEMFIATITSGGSKADASLGDRAFNARVDMFAAWIDAIVAVEIPDSETPGDETPDDETPDDETPDDETPDDENPSDESPDDESSDDEEMTCGSGPIQQAMRQVLAEILSFLASDSFVSFLQDLAEELRGGEAS